MVWLGARSKDITPLAVLDEETIYHSCFIEEVLSIALKYGNKVSGGDWIFQQDGAQPHSHHLTQPWCRNNFPSFISKGRWPPNSPNLNLLNYSICGELSTLLIGTKSSQKQR